MHDWALAAIALPVLLVGTAACCAQNGPCGAPGGGVLPAPAPAPAATAAPGLGGRRRLTTAGEPRAPAASSSAPRPADPEHAVDPPGQPHGGAQLHGLHPNPLPRTPSAATTIIQPIRHLPGVGERRAAGDRPGHIENTALNVAAVDPATYRNFTPAGAATPRSLGPGRRRRDGAPARAGARSADRRPGYLRLGSGRDAPQVARRGVRPQIPEVDAVVNTAWVKTLGMKPDNALLVSTGQTTPLSLRKPIERHRRRPGVGPEARHRGPRRPRHQRAADGVPRRIGRRRGRHLQLHRARRRPDRAGPGVGAQPHQHPARCRSWAR